jgi:hypothetical protein
MLRSHSDNGSAESPLPEWKDVFGRRADPEVISCSPIDQNASRRPRQEVDWSLISVIQVRNAQILAHCSPPHSDITEPASQSGTKGLELFANASLRRAAIGTQLPVLAILSVQGICLIVGAIN